MIIEGVETDDARTAFYSTVHGAGRRMSRTQAAGKMGVAYECPERDCEFYVARGRHESAVCPRHPFARLVKRRRRVQPGLIDYDRVRAELHGRGIELRGGAADEAPDAYKRLDAVLADHGDSIRVLHRLTPIGVAMAGAGHLRSLQGLTFGRGLELRAALEVHVRQQAVEPARQAPGALAEQRHHGGREQHAARPSRRPAIAVASPTPIIFTTESASVDEAEEHRRS